MASAGTSEGVDDDFPFDSFAETENFGWSSATSTSGCSCGENCSSAEEDNDEDKDEEDDDTLGEDVDWIADDADDEAEDDDVNVDDDFRALGTISKSVAMNGLVFGKCRSAKAREEFDIFAIQSSDRKSVV